MKWTLPILALLLLLLSGCGGTQAEPTPRPPEKAAETQATPAPTPKLLPSVEISEVMASNKATLADGAGKFPDWLELHNAGSESVILRGCTLERDQRSWRLPQLEIPAGGYHLLLASELENMTIPKAGCSLRLLDEDGDEIDAVQLPPMDEDQSACREKDGALSISAWPTPGWENSDEGYRAFQDSLTAPEGELIISEVMAYNDRYLPNNKEYYDWVEISNPTDQTVMLEYYCLSDKSKDRTLCPLPKVKLKPGKSVVFLCTDEKLQDGTFTTGFGLKSDHETLYLSTSDGTLVDYVNLHHIPVGCSYGRRSGEGGFFFMDTPTPGGANEGGERLLTPAPEALTADGVFDNVTGVTVELTGQGEIYYTLDGSRPTAESERYSGPFSVEESCVVRACCIREGYLPSETLDLSYILNEGHTMPVVSLVVSSDELFGRSGLYTLTAQDLERQGSFALFDKGQKVQLRCGVKLHGETSKVNQAKKSFRLKFIDRYEGALDYDVFSNGVTHFSSLLLRAAQEIPGARESTYMKDALMHALARESFPELPVQDHRYAVLYLNGQYWGIYNLREAHSATHLAQHYGYDEAQVIQSKGSWNVDELATQVCAFALHEDLRDEENYRYVASHLNVDSVIGWSVMEAYCGNIDSNSPNMRFYWSGEDQQLRYALVDLDLGFDNRAGFDIPFGFGFDYNRVASELMTNESFRERFYTQLHDALQGPLSDASVNQRIDRMAEELRPEIQRDAQRWNYKPGKWEAMVEDMHKYVNYGHGRACGLIDSMKHSKWLSDEDRELYFGDILAPKS